jgi:Na+-translocating ferredoxin:NAD+ oxidoreductase RnfG subunit
MFKKIYTDFKPALVLALVVVTATMLLVIMERSLQADESVLSGALKERCIEFMGEGEYEVVLDWLEAGYPIERPKGIAKLIINHDNGSIAFQTITKGYNKDGLNMLIIMNEDGSVMDLAVVQNSETPQIGTKVNERSFLDHFIGQLHEVRIVKGAAHDNEVAAITGATMSARGVADAVNVSTRAYAQLFLGEHPHSTPPRTGADVLKDLLIILMVCVLTENFVLTRFLGVCPFLGVSKRSSLSSRCRRPPPMGLTICCCAPSAWNTCERWPLS